jgi:hypothetical protein
MAVKVMRYIPNGTLCHVLSLRRTRVIKPREIRFRKVAVYPL